MATNYIGKASKAEMNRPGGRVLRAKKLTLRLLLIILSIIGLTILLMILKLDYPIIDVPGLAWTG